MPKRKKKKKKNGIPIKGKKSSSAGSIYGLFSHGHSLIFDIPDWFFIFTILFPPTSSLKKIRAERFRNDYENRMPDAADVIRATVTNLS